MNKKLFAALSLLVVILLLISGCGYKTVDQGKETQKPAKQSDTPTEQNFKIGKDEFKDEAYLTWQQKLANKKGIFINNFTQYRGVLIGLGEKNTGGYSVKVTEVKKQENKWVIKYQEVQPPKGSFVTQVINNVYEVVYIPNDKIAIEVYKIQDGTEIKETPVS
jgi:PrcB C-terminal